MAETKEVKDPFVPWESAPRVRPPWVQMKHGETIPPQKDQESNNDLADREVLQPRVEDITISSTASPLSGRHGTGNGASDEPSGSKRTYPSGAGHETGAL